MPGELRQTETGKWKIVNLKHDKAGITIPATFTYKGGDAKEIQITNSVQTVTTDWTTDVGVPISLSDVTRNYHDVVKKEGNVYKTYKAHDNFKSSDVHPITPTISLTTPLSEIESTATSISFTVISNTKTKVECGSQRQPQSGSYEAGTNTGSFTISPNIDTTAKYYTIVAYCTGQPDISTSITVTQKAFAPGVGLSVTSPINADVTTLSYTATTTPTNDLAVLVKYGSLTKSDKIGTFTISPNTSLSPVNHVITAICRDYPAYTDTATVKQKAMAYTFEVNPTFFTFPAEGSTLSQQLTINNPQGYSWQITDLSQWLHASKVQGSDTSVSITLRADANTGTTAAARSGSFTVKDVSNNKTTTVNVSQTAPALTPVVKSFDISFESDTSSTISLSPVAILSVPFTGKTQSLNVTSNTSWIVKSCPEWVTLSQMSGSGDKTLTVTIAENTGSSSRSGMIDIWTTDETTRATCQVSQNEVPSFSFEVHFSQPVNWGSYNAAYTAYTGSGDISGTYTYNGTSDSLIFGNNQIKNGDRVVHWIYNYTGSNFKIAILYDYEEPTPKDADFVNFNDNEGRGFECNAEYGKKLYIFLRN